MTEKRIARRKDRVLNTRISEELDAQLRKTAEEMDVSVSQLVRRALQRTVDMVGNLSGNVEHLMQEVVADVQNIANVAKGEATPRDLKSSPALEKVLGWQMIRAQRRSRCQLTGEQIETGDEAYASVNKDGSAPLIISAHTFEQLTEAPGEHWIEMTLTESTFCNDSNKSMQPGERAYLCVGSNPPIIISQGAYMKRKKDKA